MPDFNWFFKLINTKTVTFLSEARNYSPFFSRRF